jgi:hypothetical protein
MDGLMVSTWVFVGLVAVVAIFLLFRNTGAKKKPRIKFLPKEKVVIRAAAVEHCRGCKKPLEEGQPKSRCTKDSRHVIHKKCKELVQGKCPWCSNPLD